MNVTFTVNIFSPFNQAAEAHKQSLPLTVIHLILLLHKTELLEPLLLWHWLIDEGARLFIWLASSAADHTIDSTVQYVEALLDKENNNITILFKKLQASVKLKQTTLWFYVKTCRGCNWNTMYLFDVELLRTPCSFIALMISQRNKLNKSGWC